MKQILEEIDLFGHHFNFSVFNKKEHRTSIGGILSLLSILRYNITLEPDEVKNYIKENFEEMFLKRWEYLERF